LDFFPESFFFKYKQILDQAIPQFSIFLVATIFETYIRIKKEDQGHFLNEFKENNEAIIVEMLQTIFKFSDENPDVANKSWPTLLKSQSFFTHICSYLKGQEYNKAEQNAAPGLPEQHGNK
jgi:hypothetical protein